MDAILGLAALALIFVAFVAVVECADKRWHGRVREGALSAERTPERPPAKPRLVPLDRDDEER